MDFDDAVKIINRLLKEKRPDTFNSSWILKNAPNVYRYIQKNIRSDVGGIDWDRFTRSLDRRIQKKWRPRSRNKIKRYRAKAEVEVVFKKYKDKLYVFLAPRNREDEYIRDSISIALVRIAQKGNLLAREEIIKLIRFTIDEWIESRPTLSSWEGYEFMIPHRIETCIRRYRYSGTFIGYLLKTFEYSGRGLRATTSYLQE